MTEQTMLNHIMRHTSEALAEQVLKISRTSRSEALEFWRHALSITRCSADLDTLDYALTLLTDASDPQHGKLIDAVKKLTALLEELEAAEQAIRDENDHAD